MLAKRQKRKPTTRSGPPIAEADRHTRQIKVRVAPEVETRWRTLARQLGVTLSEVATKALALLEAQGQKGGSR